MRDNHFSPSRQLDKDNVLDKIIISENVLKLHKADDSRERAMNKYWLKICVTRKWHFI